MVVDTHVHVVAPDPRAYPLQPAGLPGAWYREAPVSAEALQKLMDEAGVDRAVLVQPIGAYSHDCRYTVDSARRFPRRFVSVCSVDIEAEDPAADLARWVQEGGAAGVRLFALSAEPRCWLDEPRARPLWECARALGIHVVATIFTHQLPGLRAALERYPDVPVSLDHCAFPPLEAPSWRGSEALFALADLPNLHLKVSTNVLHAAERAGDPAELVALLAERFGARRLRWGSDFSQTHDAPYEDLVRYGHRAFAKLSPEDRAWCLGESARALFPGLRGGEERA